MDGVSLSHLTPGATYDVPSELGFWLISRGVAEYVTDTSEGVVMPLDNPLAFEQLTQGVSVVPPIASVDDESEPNRRRRPPRKKR
jgi:hypothetical protein